MKFTVKIALAASLLAIAQGCGYGRNVLKHAHSSLTGLHRIITLYNCAGLPIREWDITAQVIDKGGTCQFIDDNGKAVIVSGTFIIQEK